MKTVLSLTLLAFSLPFWTAQVMFRGQNAGHGGNPVQALVFSQTGSTLTITCNTTSTSIWYRTDGIAATPTDTLYTAPITVTTGEHVTAVCAYTGASNTGALSGSTGWKCNAPGAPVTNPETTWTCNSSGGVGTNPLSDFNLTFSGGVGTQTVATTYSGAGDAQILFIYQPNSVTCNACITHDQHIAYTDTPSPAAALENREFDQQMLVDFNGYTKVLAQFSSQCQGSSGKLEINASGSWNKINVPCTLTHGDWQIGGHIEGPGVGNCTAAAMGTSVTYGCAVFDYAIDNLTSTYYGPIAPTYCISGTTCDTYPLIQQSTWSYFAASGQSQQDVYNTTTAGGSPSSSSSSITTYTFAATKGIVARASTTAS